MDAQDKENLMTLFDDFSYVCSSVFLEFCGDEPTASPHSENERKSITMKDVRVHERSLRI